MKETQVWSLGREGPLKKEMATHSSIPMDRGTWLEAVQKFAKSWTWLSMQAMQQIASSYISQSQELRGEANLIATTSVVNF